MPTRLDFSTLSLMDALDLATLIEVEAYKRYTQFAERLGSSSDDDAASVFQSMAVNENKHGEEIAERRVALFGDVRPNVKLDDLFDIEAPDFGASRQDLSALEAYEVALSSEKKAFDFYDRALRHVDHPEVKSLADLKGKPVAIGPASDTTFWPWLRSAFGFTDAQKRPYGFSVQPFLADKALSQQGYVTSEPFSIEKGGVKPVVFLLADQGYPPYAETIVVTRDTLAKRGDAVRRFIRASAEGWKRYLQAPAPGNALIKKDNPQMEDDLIAHGISTMKQYALVTGGDAARLGIMTMTDARWKQTHEFMLSAGLVKSGVDYRKAYTLELLKDVRVLP